MRNMNKMCFIGTASIAVATEYNKNPDADFVAIGHEHRDSIVEDFKDHAFYKYNTDLTMDGQPIESNKKDRGSMTAEEMKRMLNKVYGRSWNAYAGGYSV